MMTIEELYEIYRQHPSIQTDTRLLKPGDLYFALKGPLFNGNQFALQALEKGACFAIVDEAPENPSAKIIVMDDVLGSLQALAKHHRLRFTIPFIAVTGSNGKTTTRELIQAVLSSSFITYATHGNLNNHIGIPLTILRIPDDAEMAVIEMGANHQQEIAGYCEYARPTHGLITNAGKAHLEGFGGIEGVKKGKKELFDFLKRNNGTAFIMKDYAYLHEMSAGIPHVITYGTSGADVNGVVRDSDPFLTVEIKRDTQIIHISTRLVGDYNLPNVLAAYAVGNYFKIPGEKIKLAIEQYDPSNSRSQLVMQGSNHIILDAYNANPSSMKAAIENFAGIKAENKILILGAMAELGEESLEEHARIITLIDKYKWKQVALTGGDFDKLAHPYQRFKTSADAAVWFRNQDFKNSYILVKGSRSMQMEKVLSPNT